METCKFNAIECAYTIDLYQRQIQGHGLGGAIHDFHIIILFNTIFFFVILFLTLGIQFLDIQLGKGTQPLDLFRLN